MYIVQWLCRLELTPRLHTGLGEYSQPSARQYWKPVKAWSINFFVNFLLRPDNLSRARIKYMAFFLAKCWCNYSILIFRDRTIMFLPDFCCSIPPFVWSANSPMQTLPNVSPLLLYAHDLQYCNNELWRRKGKEITQFCLQPFCLGCLGRQGTWHQYL